MCYQKMSKFRRKFLLIPIILIFPLIFLNQLLCPSVTSLTELHKCPHCYGISACHLITENTMKIQPFDFYTTMSHLVSAKNVFYGKLNDEKIVIKKLAQSNELEAFDEMTCKEASGSCVKTKSNDVAHAIDYFSYYSRILNDVSTDFINDDRSGLILCPHPEKTQFFKRINNASGAENFKLNYLNLWTLVRINPEPIILEILRSEEGWPMPRYYGACGRIVIEEYVGLPLPAYYHSGWLLRGKISLGLLRAVQMLTFRDTDYSYYLTDMSPDNIAINHELQPVFVDLEHLIVVQKEYFSQDEIEKSRDLHETEDTVDCKNCFVFSPLDICNHRISDHNYYAICKHILSSESSTISGGFLHDVPKDISSRYPDLKILLAECSVPSGRQTRIAMADKLIELLEKIIS